MGIEERMTCTCSKVAKKDGTCPAVLVLAIRTNRGDAIPGAVAKWKAKCHCKEVKVISKVVEYGY